MVPLRHALDAARSTPSVAGFFLSHRSRKDLLARLSGWREVPLFCLHVRSQRFAFSPRELRAVPSWPYARASSAWGAVASDPRVGGRTTKATTALPTMIAAIM